MVETAVLYQEAAPLSSLDTLDTLDTPFKISPPEKLVTDISPGSWGVSSILRDIWQQQIHAGDGGASNYLTDWLIEEWGEEEWEGLGLAKPGWVPRVLDCLWILKFLQLKNCLSFQLLDRSAHWQWRRVGEEAWCWQNPAGCCESSSKTTGWPRLAKSSPPGRAYPAKWQNIFRRISSTKLNILK